MQHAERDAHGRRHADGRRAANHHVADGLGHFLVGAAGDVRLFERQARLVDHDHGAIGPLDGFNHVWGRILPLREQREKKRALYAACMMAAALVEPVAWRIQPKAAPASAITRRVPPGVAVLLRMCSSPNGRPPAAMPGTAPRLRTSSGCRNPRKASSSQSGPRVMPKVRHQHHGGAVAQQFGHGVGSVGRADEVRWRRPPPQRWRSRRPPATGTARASASSRASARTAGRIATRKIRPAAPRTGTGSRANCSASSSAARPARWMWNSARARLTISSSPAACRESPGRRRGTGRRSPRTDRARGAGAGAECGGRKRPVPGSCGIMRRFSISAAASSGIIIS